MAWKILIVALGLAGSYFIVDPFSYLAGAKNAQRWSDVRAILDAEYQWSIANRGISPKSISSELREICRYDRHSNKCTMNQVTLYEEFVDEQLMKQLPVDPKATGTGTGYAISIALNGRTTVKALLAEGGEVIQVTR